MESLARWTKCVAPLACTFLGFALARLLPLIDGSERTGAPHGMVTAFAHDMLVLAFGLCGWSVAVVVVQGRRLHCGGTNSIEQPGEVERFVEVILVPLLFVLVVASFSLGGGNFSTFFGSLLVFFLIMIGELVSGNPLEFIPVLRSLGRRL